MMDLRAMDQAEIAAARLHGLCQIADDLLKNVEHGGEVPRWAHQLDALHQTLVREAAALLAMIEGLSRDGHRLAVEDGRVGTRLLDELASLYTGDENDRAQVKKFVDTMKGIAMNLAAKAQDRRD